MEYIFVVMIRPHLRDIPQVALPEGYHFRMYRPGDRDTWVRIHQESEPFIKITSETFDREFGSDDSVLARRMMFLVAPDGQDVGTITAWFDRNYKGKPYGRIHWVSLHPDHRGKGLSKAMMTVALNLMKKLGHKRAILGTQTPRIPAITTYLGYGFVPDMTVDRAEEAWQLVRQEIRPEKFAQATKQTGT